MRLPGALLPALYVLLATSVVYQESEASGKIDARLKWALEAGGHSSKTAGAPPASPLGIFIEHLYPLPATGCAAAMGRSVRAGNSFISTAVADPGCFAGLASMPGVEGIYLSNRLKPLLDLSVPAARGREGERIYGATGRGVIAGFVDLGLDTTHPDFRNPDGSTRLARLWDQTQEGRHPEGFSYGAECGPDEIESGECPEEDSGPYGGHGSHVAGIAAGSDAVYRGVAPEAMIIFVKARLEEANVVDAVSYIFNLAAAENRPAVINISLGEHIWAHDGTSPFERALSALTGPGRIIVAAGGNEGSGMIHAGFDANSTLRAAPFSVKNSDEADIEFWLKGG